MKGHNMIGTLARKRTNLAALALLAALAVALFAVIQSVAAIDGSVTVEIGDDAEDTGTVPAGTGYDNAESADVTIATVAYTANQAEATVTGVAAGRTTITISDSETTDPLPDLVYEVEVLPFGIGKIEFVDESDAIVKAGTVVTVRVTLQSQGDNSEVNLTIPTTGLSIALTDGTTQSRTEDTDDTSKQASWTLNTAGAPEGDYTLTFVADYDDTDADDATKDVTGTTVLTIGEPGEGLASAALTPANVKDGAPSTAADAAPDKTTKEAGSTIYLAVTSSNSLGSNSNPGDVDQVIVFAVGATISDDANANPEGNSKTFDTDVGAVQVFAVTSTDPASITVRATVIGPSGSQSTEAVDLIFSGDAETISLSDPDDQLGQNGDSIMLEVTAVDASGNTATIDATSITGSIVDTEGNPAANLSVSDAQKVDDKGTADDESDDETIPTAVIVTVSSTDVANVKADRGVYTVNVRLNNDADTEQSVEVTVVGATDEIKLAADPAAGANFGDIITVTATLTDEGDKPVADGTTVDFSVTPGTGLAHIGASETDVETKDGAATSKYAVVGEGVSVVSAVADDTGVSGVVVVMSTAGTADAMDDEPSLSDFSRLSGLVSYSGPDATASALSSLLAGRASAIWLSNNGSWILYASVDGAMVPGSSDFTVTSGDVLYISN